MTGSRRSQQLARGIAWLLGGMALTPTAAWAGGYEFLGNGTAALGRGAAFTARADDATAVEYNVAGLARQRGTRTLIDGKLTLNTYDFQRDGSYPIDSSTAFSGQPYSQVSNTNGIFFAPFIGVTTDFHRLDRWTFGISLYGPNAGDGNRSYPATVNGMPAPQRYDTIRANLLVIYPTLSAAVRVTKWLDLGLSLHLVYANFNLQASAFADLARSSTFCPYPEATQCDLSLTIKTSAFTATASAGAMFHPLEALSIGVHLRAPVIIDSSGTVGATLNDNAIDVLKKSDLSPQPGSFHTKLPWILRLGIRYAFLGSKGENGDIELDGSYEAWHDAQGVGDRVAIPQLGSFTDVNAVILHDYRDTFSVRLGGQYNLYVKNAVLMFRLGAYFDSAATYVEDTRLDFDTMAKYAATVGFGFKLRGISVNFAYAYVYEPDRTVTQGSQRVLNGVTGGTQGADGQQLPVFNNGHYHAQNLVIGFGIQIRWDELLKRQRVLKYD
jgi:long-subunit fatty acid transport protein